ncbi:MAG TPA: ATPase, partial [Coxiellaceae bacterium]|nr:ATPase [Coxiellaceae bacterium]
MTTLQKTWFLLTDKYKNYAIVLLFLMLIGGVLEMIGIGIIIPILGLIINSNFVDRYPIFIPLLKMLGNPNSQVLIIISMLFFVVMYIIKV